MAKSHIALSGLLLTAAICLLLNPAMSLAAGPSQPSWQVGYRATNYSFQTQGNKGADINHSHQFHALSGSASGLAGGWLTFRGAGRFANDQLNDVNATEQSKLYTGLLEARFNSGLKAQVGRQFIQAGVTNLTVDGALLNFRLDRTWDLTAYAGAKAPSDKAFELAEFDNDTAAGARINFRPNRTWKVGASMGYRESAGLVAERPIGAEIVTSAVRNTRIFGRVAYDLQQERWAKIQAQAQWRRSAGSPVIDFQYIDRHPTIDAASWFSRFTDLKRIRIARAAVRHELPNRFGGEFEYLGSFVGDVNSSRLGLADLVPGGRIGYSVRLGDRGEESRFYGELSHRFYPWLQLGIEGSVLTYALMSDAPVDQDRDLSTLAARARIDLRPGLRVLAEVQSMDNPFYDQDVRFLLGVDVSLARGSSRLGLDRGGWLK
jgi:hypothetical protein